MTRIAVTMGDPCGIGPEVAIRSIAEQLDEARFVTVGDPEVMSEAVRRFGSARMKRLWALSPKVVGLKEAAGHGERTLVLISRGSLSFRDLKPGRPGIREGKAAWSCLETAFELVDRGVCKALVTSPVSKAALKAAGFPAPGHTDWLAEKTGARAIMMLVAGRFRVVPVTVHVPLSAVSGELSTAKVVEAIVVVDSELKKKFGIKSPGIAVAGLNPHAGEGGMLGREEEEVIVPAIKEAGARGIRVTGPHPADTMFTPAARKAYDVAICMYHDQAMIPVKTIGMDKAVNLTLGLPLVRTSPAHGTAPEIAWSGQARPDSMIEAVKLAIKLSRQ